MTVLFQPWYELSTLYWNGSGREIVLFPHTFWTAGLKGAELDDAVLRILLMRFAQVFAAGRLPAGPTQGSAFIERAVDLDALTVRQRWMARAGWGSLALVIGLLLLAGWMDL